MKKYRLKPLLKKFGYKTLEKECQREGWLIPSHTDLENTDLEYENVWVSNKVAPKELRKHLNEDDHADIELGKCYSPEKDRIAIVNKDFMMNCVVLVEVKA